MKTQRKHIRLGRRKAADSFQRRSCQYCNHDHFLICILNVVAVTTKAPFDPTEPQYEIMQIMVKEAIWVSQIAK